MKKNNIYILLIIQALLSILLLFVESSALYVALGLFLVIDLAVFTSLLMRKWSARELYIFITLFVSLVYLLFLFFIKGDLLIAIAIGQFLLFLLSAVISYENSIPRILPAPIKPASKDTWTERNILAEKDNWTGIPRQRTQKSIPFDTEKLETYDLEDMEHDLDELDKQKKSKRKDDAKFRAKALAYELEREASELKRAETFVRNKETLALGSELEREAKIMETVAKQANTVELALKEAELKRGMKELVDSEKKVHDVKLLGAKKELELQAKQLKDAENKIKEIEFLNKQQKINRQAIELAKAQTRVSKVQRKKSSKTKTAKTQSAKSSKTVKEPVFATKKGNNFHETGCMVIKKIPKKNLILFNTQKGALKKGYKPCNVCKP